MSVGKIAVSFELAKPRLRREISSTLVTIHYNFCDSFPSFSCVAHASLTHAKITAYVYCLHKTLMVILAHVQMDSQERTAW